MKITDKIDFLLAQDLPKEKADGLRELKRRYQAVSQKDGVQAAEERFGKLINPAYDKIKAVVDKAAADKKKADEEAEKERKGNKSESKTEAHKKAEHKKSKIDNDAEKKADDIIKKMTSDPRYQALRGTTSIPRDSHRQALPPGRRVSKNGNVYYETRKNESDVSQGRQYPMLAKGGDVDKSVQLQLEKELHRLQRDLNSHRLLTYKEGDTSAEEMARQKERAVKMKRFNEVLALLNKLDKENQEKGNTKKFAKGGAAEHGLKTGDEIVADQFWDDSIVVDNKRQRVRAEVDLNTGKRKEAKYAKGGVVRIRKQDEAYRLTPFNSIPKEIMNRVKFTTDSYSFAGNFFLPQWKKGGSGDAYIYELDDFDKDIVSEVPLKPGEKIFRYFTERSAMSGIVPFIKINLKSGLVYFMDEKDPLSLDGVVFEKKGITPQYLNYISDEPIETFEIVTDADWHNIETRDSKQKKHKIFDRKSAGENRDFVLMQKNDGQWGVAVYDNKAKREIDFDVYPSEQEARKKFDRFEQFAEGGEIGKEQLTAPDNYVFAKINSHRAVQNATRLDDAKLLSFSSFYKNGYYYLMSKSDYGKISKRKGVGKAQTKITGNWFPSWSEGEPSSDEKQLRQKLYEANPDFLKKGGITAQADDYVKWEMKAIREIEELMDVDTSDAQSIVEAHPEIMEKCWDEKCTPQQVAEAYNRPTQNSSGSTLFADGGEVAEKELTSIVPVSNNKKTPPIEIETETTTARFEYGGDTTPRLIPIKNVFVLNEKEVMKAGGMVGTGHPIDKGKQFVIVTLTKTDDTITYGRPSIQTDYASAMTIAALKEAFLKDNMAIAIFKGKNILYVKPGKKFPSQEVRECLSKQLTSKGE